jgi:hypothetical protein
MHYPVTEVRAINVVLQYAPGSIERHAASPNIYAAIPNDFLIITTSSPDSLPVPTRYWLS